MATLDELAVIFRAGINASMPEGKGIDSDRAKQIMIGLFVQEAQYNNFDPLLYSIPEEIFAYAADRVMRLCGDQAWADGDWWLAQQQQ